MTQHPLDPLTADEIRAVAAILLRERGVARPGWRIASIELAEPAKDVVRAFRAGDPVERAARAVVWDTGEGTAYVAVLSLTGDTLVSWDAQAGRQPNATTDEWSDCDAAMRAHPAVVAALAERGVTDMDLVLVDMWTYGAHLIPPAHAGRRIGWCDVWVRGAHDSNPYAHPVSGLKLVVDLNTMELLEIEDTGGAGFPEVQGEYVPKHVPGLVERTDRRPLHVSQPDGVSFTLDGHELSWQKWRMRLGFTYREGLVLHTVGYDGRSVAHRISFAEMVVPYRDPSPDHVRRTAYDIGEWGLGFMTTSLELGCDCLGEIRYLDAVLHDTAGEPKTVRNAICVHEEDNGVLWKHVDSRAGAEVRRMRRLVVSCHVTVANYEYLIYWRFHEDGSIESEVRATGIMVTTPFEGDAPPYGTVVDTSTYAPIHQHFIVARLDMEVDGPENTVVMTETAQPPIGPDNPHGLALTQRSVPLRTEAEGRQDYDWSTQRAWKVTNPGRLNKVGAPVAYKLVPGAAIPPMLDHASPVFRRAQVLGHTLWVTPFDAAERWPCGEFVNQSGADALLPAEAQDSPADALLPAEAQDSPADALRPAEAQDSPADALRPAEAQDSPADALRPAEAQDSPADDGLPVWTAANRSIDNTDIVLWYVFGIHHVPRVEDWPVMPSDTVSFWLKPSGFFDANPALDVKAGS